MSNTYHNGDEVRFKGTFTDADGAVQDPSTVYFQILNPSETTTSYQYTVDVEVKRESEGIYYIDLPLTTEGWWYYRWYSTGSGRAADEGGVYVEPSRFA